MRSGARASVAPPIRLEPWTEHDLPLLRRLNEPRMTEHLGGPETEETLSRRLARYIQSTTRNGRMFKIVLISGGPGIGSVGYWERPWRGAAIYETGWSVLPQYQGRGIATEAVRSIVSLARSERGCRLLEAFPSVDNAASNAICRKLGFEFVGECDFEYPPGHSMRCNEWRLDLWARHGAVPGSDGLLPA